MNSSPCSINYTEHSALFYSPKAVPESDVAESEWWLDRMSDGILLENPIKSDTIEDFKLRDIMEKGEHKRLHQFKSFCSKPCLNPFTANNANVRLPWYAWI